MTSARRCPNNSQPSPARRSDDGLDSTEMTNRLCMAIAARIETLPTTDVLIVAGEERWLVTPLATTWPIAVRTATAGSPTATRLTPQHAP